MSPVARAAVGAAWSWPGTLSLFAILMLMLWAPVLPTVEGTLLPVTSPVTFADVKPFEGGLSVRMNFDKVRDCQYLGVSLDRDGVNIQFEPIDGGEPLTLPTGQRISRQWFAGTDNLDNVRLRWVHRCNPFWVTVTQGYP